MSTSFLVPLATVQALSLLAHVNYQQHHDDVYADLHIGIR
jgi:hypothetical protein